MAGATNLPRRPLLRSGRVHDNPRSSNRWTAKFSSAALVMPASRAIRSSRVNVSGGKVRVICSRLPRITPLRSFGSVA